MPPLETRTVSAAFEVRSDASTVTLEGYAATFNQAYDLGVFREQIDPAAFNRTLGTQPDVRLLVDHEGQPLARTKSGTMQLAADSSGLHARAVLDRSDPDVQRLEPKMRRGDLDQMSFAFRVPAGGDEWSPDWTLRTLRQVELNGGDVSVVTYPANPATSVSLRSVSRRSALVALADAMFREVREGKTVSSANMARLRRVLDALAKADDNLDAAEAAVAEILGVPDPDNDDADKAATTQLAAQLNSAASGEMREQMSTADINDLPDSDFAYIEPGGEKDAAGKTTPRSLRHFPIHDADHVRNALARAPQSPFGDKAMPKILAAAKKFGVDAGKNSHPLGLAQAIVTRLSIPA